MVAYCPRPDHCDASLARNLRRFDIEQTFRLLKQTLGWLKEEKAMQADRTRLTKACCSPSKYALLDGAPIPSAIPESTCEAC